MTIDPSCMYCTQDQRVTDLMITVRPLRVSTLYLFREQTHPGRCIVAFNQGHIGNLFDLSEAQRAELMEDLSAASAAIQKVFSPDKINTAAFGDKVPHIHFHLVPKYKDGVNWGGTFEMMPADKKLLTDSDYQDVIQQLKAALNHY